MVTTSSAADPALGILEPEAPEWARRCRALASEEAAPSAEGVHVLRGHWPRAIVHETVRLLLGFSLAATAVVLALFRWRTEGPDALALLAELVALAATLRTLFALLRWARRLREAWAASRWVLVLCPEGLWIRTPFGERCLPRAALLDARAEGAWASRPSPDRWAELWLVHRPQGSPRGALPWIRLPPVFELPPSALAEHLMRWRGPLPDVEPPEPPPLPSRIYEEAAAGKPSEGCLPLPLRPTWLRQAPMLTPLFGLVLLHVAAFADGAPGVSTSGLARPFLLLGLALLLLPAAWAALAWHRLRPRRGLALLLHPGALMIRHRGGILEVPWRDARRAYVEERPAWNVLQGGHRARSLVLERREAPVLRYEEAWLGVPAEPLASLCEAYRRGLILAPRTAP